MKGDNITCKVVLVGDSGVGKTCIIQRYVNDNFVENSESTITSSYTYKKIDYKQFNKSISFDIWDTAGQELYRALAKNFYLNASIGILVYDIRRRNSFESLKTYWHEQLKVSGEDNMVLAVAGNKCDLYLEEKVTEAEGKQLAKDIRAVFRLTSCKENIGIEELFEECGRKYLENNNLIKANEAKDNKFNLNDSADNADGKKKKKCC